MPFRFNVITVAYRPPSRDWVEANWNFEAVHGYTDLLLDAFIRTLYPLLLLYAPYRRRHHHRYCADTCGGGERGSKGYEHQNNGWFVFQISAQTNTHPLFILHKTHTLRRLLLDSLLHFRCWFSHIFPCMWMRMLQQRLLLILRCCNSQQITTKTFQKSKQKVIVIVHYHHHQQHTAKVLSVWEYLLTLTLFTY